MNVLILYFSGTGNTEVIANLLGSEFRNRSEARTIETFRVEDILFNNQKIDTDKYDIIGIGYPIYGFNPPFNIFKLVKTFKRADNKKIFLFSTCAAPIYLNSVASSRLKKDLRKKGYSVTYEKQFYLSSNFVVRYADELIKQLHDAAKRKVKLMVDDIFFGKVNSKKEAVFSLLFQYLSSTLERASWGTVSLDFKVLKKCNLCEKCITQCPQKNIKLKGDKIKFGSSCLACYRCVYSCSQAAITGRLYKFAIIKNGYNIKKILDSDAIAQNNSTKNAKGYYKMFFKYLHEDND